MPPPSVPADAVHITADWLEPIVGPVGEVIAEQIGADYGFAGTSFLVTMRRADGSLEEVVVKVANAERTRSEIDFYTSCAHTTPIETPGFIHGATDGDSGVVVLEHLAGMSQGDVLTGCSEAQFLSLASTLGRLHGRWWGATDTALDPLRVEINEPRLIEGRAEVAASRHGTPENLPELISCLAGRLTGHHFRLMQGPLTLTHRDFHLDNILFDGASQPFVLDWQGAAVGPPAVDVARIFIECRPPELTTDLVTAALASYTATLAEHDVAIRMREFLDLVAAAIEISLALTINWLGGDQPADPGSRMAALQAVVMRNLSDAVRVLENLGGHFTTD